MWFENINIELIAHGEEKYKQGYWLNFLTPSGIKKICQNSGERVKHNNTLKGRPMNL